MAHGKDKYRLLVENHPDLFACCQVVTDSAGKPVDYIFLDLNNAFTEMTGPMTGGGPYKKAISQGEVVAELKRCAGSQFDPEMVEVFVSVLEEQAVL